MAYIHNDGMVLGVVHFICSPCASSDAIHLVRWYESKGATRVKEFFCFSCGAT